MEKLLSQPEGHLRREASGPFFAPVRTRSTCSGEITTEASSTTNEEVEEQQCNLRRITLCKQVLLEATTRFSTTSRVELPVLKSAACRNSGALLPLLSMLAAEQEPACMVKCLDTLSFLLLDRANRRACLELRGLDVVLDILRRSIDQQILFSALEALCSLCKHDARDKMALWQHPNKGALLSMLSSRHNSSIVVETLRTCRTLCFAFNSSSVCVGLSGNAEAADSQAACRMGQPCRDRCSPHQGPRHDHQHGHHQQHQQHGALQLLEPALLTVVAELLHPSTDVHVLMKALKLLHTASTIVTFTNQPPGGCGCWHNAVFRIVPLLTHCAELDVVDGALAVLVNLSEHDIFHNMFFASGCISPLLHLLSHKRCSLSQSASCVLSALAEGGLSRDKLCQDTALLAMLRVLQTNHCVVVTLGVLYMLGRLASYRGQVVRSLKGWGAVPLLLRLLATTRDEDAAEVCRQLLQQLGVQPPAAGMRRQQGATEASHANGGNQGGQKLTLHAAYSSIIVFDGAGAGAGNPAAGVGLCRTISAAATVAAAGGSSEVPALHTGISARRGAPESGASQQSAAERDDGDQGHLALALARTQHSSFRFYGGAGAAACGPVGPIAAAVTQAAAY